MSAVIACFVILCGISFVLTTHHDTRILHASWIVGAILILCGLAVLVTLMLHVTPSLPPFGR